MFDCIKKQTGGNKTGIKEVDSFLLTVQISFYRTTEIVYDIIKREGL